MQQQRSKGSSTASRDDNQPQKHGDGSGQRRSGNTAKGRGTNGQHYNGMVQSYPAADVVPMYVNVDAETLKSYIVQQM